VRAREEEEEEENEEEEEGVREGGREGEKHDDDRRPLAYLWHNGVPWHRDGQHM
jgi:hypothetical protein